MKTRQQRLAHEESRRERHARLVTERSGDPRFVQRTTLPDGSATIRWQPETPVGRDISNALEAQRARFTERFGREPGPRDPVFFDPDKDEPSELDEQHVAAAFDEMIASARQAGTDPTVLMAARDLGYLVTAENMHLFSAAEIEAWHDTVDGYCDDEEDDLCDEEAYEHDNNLFDVLDVMFRVAVDQTLEEKSGTAARETAQIVIDGDAELAASGRTAGDGFDGAGVTGLSMAFTVLAGWLTAAREDQDDPHMADVVLSWIRTELGPELALRAATASALVGSTSHSALTEQQLLDELRDDFLPALTWLAAGVVARYGNGDTDCLPYPDHLDDTRW